MPLLQGSLSTEDGSDLGPVTVEAWYSARLAAPARPDDGAEPDHGAEPDRGDRSSRSIEQPVPAELPRRTVAPARVQARVDTDGRFVLALPALDAREDEFVLITVSAPSGIVLGRRRVEVRDQPVEIEMSVLPAPAIAVKPPKGPRPQVTRKLNGRVLDQGGRTVPAGLQVIVLVVVKGTRRPVPALVARTESGGYFSAPYTPASVESAQAKVQGVADPAQIGLVDDGLPIPLLILVDLPLESKPAQDDDCECGCGSPTVPRAPDQIDLANSPDTYSADLGGGKCVQFTVPNRAIEEFSYHTVVRTTEPEIRGITLADGGVAAPDVAAPPPDRAPGRAPLTAANAVDWDSTPTFYEATSVAHGHILQFRQTWFADGYSLGDLLYSLPLAPGQKRLVAVVDWERREQASRREETSFGESLIASLTRDRDLGEVISGTLAESLHGGSSASTSGVAAGAGAAGNGSYYGMNFGALMGVSGGYGYSDANAWQESARGAGAQSLQQLRDRTLQSASAVRGLRSSVVHSATQGEAVRASTEVVANHNRCHALTVQYFEVLRHLRVTHEIADVRECVFVPFPMASFDVAKALRWREALLSALRRPELAQAFDAAYRVATNWTGSAEPSGRYGDEPMTAIAGELMITVLIPLPPLPERLKPTAADTAAQAADKLAEATKPATGLLGILQNIALGGLPDLFGKATDLASQGAHAVAESLYREPTAEERYGRFHHEVMPGVAAGFVDGLELWAVVGNNEVRLDGMDFTLVSDYRAGEPLLVSVRGSVAAGVARSAVSRISVRSRHALPTGCRVIVGEATLRYRTALFEHSLVDDRRVGDDIDVPRASVDVTPEHVTVTVVSRGSGATLFTPLDAWEQRDPKKEDTRSAAELVDHLDDHLEYYHHAIWWRMDANRRYMLLDGYLAPNSRDRSLASVLDNRPIGVVGNSMVFPVAQGVHLDPRFAAAAEDEPIDLVRYYRPETPLPPVRISLPTRGVFAEAVQGACNACEQIDDTRVRWEDAPLDDVPGIATVSTASRRAEPGSTAPSAFPAPIVAIQNAPAAPDPVGVTAAADLLAKSSFPDVTGLAATQAAASAAYQKAMDTAAAFGKEASNLAQQAAAAKGIDKALDAIDKTEGAGGIDAGDAKNLRLTALKNLVGGGDAMTTAEAQELLDAIRKAAASGSISQDDQAELSKTVLQQQIEPGKQQRPESQAAAKKIDEIDPGEVDKVHVSDGGCTTTVATKRPRKRTMGISLTARDKGDDAFLAHFDLGVRHVETGRLTSIGFDTSSGGVDYQKLSDPLPGTYVLEGRVVRVGTPGASAEVEAGLVGTNKLLTVSLTFPLDLSETRFYLPTGTFTITPKTTSINLETVPTVETITIDRSIDIDGGVQGSSGFGASLEAKLPGLLKKLADAKGGLKMDVKFGGSLKAGQSNKFTVTYQRITGVRITQVKAS